MKRPHTIIVFFVTAGCALTQVPMVPSARWFDYQELIDRSNNDARQASGASGSQTVSLARLRHKIPGKAMAAFSRALKLARKLEWQQGVGELQAALAIDPEFSDAHENLGVHYIMLDRASDALPELHRAVALDPSTSGNHSNLAVAYMLLDQRGAAKTEVETAVTLDSRNAAAQFLLGLLLAQNPREVIEARRRLHFAMQQIPEAQLLLMQLDQVD